MLDYVIKIAGMIVTATSTVVKAIELYQKAKKSNQKSNRHSPK